MFVVDRRRSTAKVGAALVMAAFVAGCSGSGSSPTILPPVSTTPAANASTAPPQDPKAAAVAVVKQYFRLLNNLEQDMNADGFEAITARSCPCRQFARDVRTTAAKGQRYFGRVRITSVAPAIDSNSQVEVLISYDSSPGGTKDSSGKVLFEGPKRTGVRELFIVSKVRSTWLIHEIRILK